MCVEKSKTENEVSFFVLFENGYYHESQAPMG